MELRKDEQIILNIDGFIISQSIHNKNTAQSLFGIKNKNNLNIGHDDRTWVLERDIICDTCNRCVGCQTCNSCDGCVSTVGCNDKCQGCTGSCTGCASNCYESCFGDCYTCQDCQTGCTSCNACTAGCDGGCQTECYTCVNCDGCVGCDGDCVGCFGGCQESCQNCTACANCTACVSCQTGCQTGCFNIVNVTSTCIVGCQTTCQTCTGCDNNCYTSCTLCNGCTSSCQGGCQTGCQTGCTGSCQTCYDGCNGTCDSGDYASCVNCVNCDGCVGCQTSCVNCVGGQGSKIYDYYCYPGQGGGNTSGENTSCSGGGYDGEQDLSLNPPPPEWDGSADAWAKADRKTREEFLTAHGYEIRDHGVDTSENPGIPLKDLELQDENVKIIVDKDPDTGDIKYTYVDKDTGEVKGEVIKNGATGKYTGWSKKSDGTQLNHNYDTVDPNDGFASGKTEIIRPGEDYIIEIDTAKDGETTVIDPNSNKEVNVPPSAAGC